ncbi:hypothetical protein MSIMFB_02638 [Mycobacterium simulans]|uniref:Uncharacterized protein n=1 Tax=Mycobacterium simulans TaxID=627089 RepID=A0A7Z7IKC2_9MYCO|nr:hypothetical protein MSIMFB_02638 [Mycobacterium simulans]
MSHERAQLYKFCGVSPYKHARSRSDLVALGGVEQFAGVGAAAVGLT